MPLSPAVQKELTKAREVEAEIAQTYRQTSGEVIDQRTMLIVAALNVVCEHHSSMLTLIASGHHSSALSLIRVTHDAMIRLHWLTLCAKDDQIGAICTSYGPNGEYLGKKDAFPSTGNAAKQVDRELASRKVEIKVSLEKCHRDLLHDFNHMGFAQLAFRVDEDGRINSAVPDYTLISGLQLTTEAAAHSTLLFLNFVNRRDLLKKLADFYKQSCKS